MVAVSCFVNAYLPALSSNKGTAGILSVLLSCRLDEIQPHIPGIVKSISQLCRVGIAHNGHLPMSIPPMPSSASRTSPLVQICHGAPGLLLLLACAQRNRDFAQRYWRNEWYEALGHASQRVWEEGLLSKGGGVCHGIAGNAFPWITFASAAGSGEKDADVCLGFALPMLLHARETRPFRENEQFRMPDHPYSLFEGLAGTALVWAYACGVIEEQIEFRRTGQQSKSEATMA